MRKLIQCIQIQLAPCLEAIQGIQMRARDEMICLSKQI